MRAVVQRVSEARVTVGSASRADRRRADGARGRQGDGPADVAYIASKIRDLRIFEDEGDDRAKADEPLGAGRRW
jgi:D-Tyr-tRNAtyr deacylase